MIALLSAIAFATEPASPAEERRRSERQLSLVLLAESKGQYEYGVVLERDRGGGAKLDVAWQFPFPITIGVAVVGGALVPHRAQLPEGYPELFYDLAGPDEAAVDGWIAIWPEIGYTVRIHDVDVTPLLYWPIDANPRYRAQGRWWIGNSFALQAEIGSRPFVQGHAEYTELQFGVGAAWRWRPKPISPPTPPW